MLYIFHAQMHTARPDGLAQPIIGIVLMMREMLLPTNDKIKDVAVIGLPDARLGEIAAAVIGLKEDVSCTEEEIMEFCRELPRYKRPKKIIFRLSKPHRWPRDSYNSRA